MRARICTIAVLLLLLGYPASPARADGMMIPPPGWSIWEYEQLGFVEWDEDAHAETITLLPGFQGTAREFAWVVPVPSVPEVTPASRELFVDLAGITAPVYRYRDDGWDCDRIDRVDYGADPPDVDVIRHELVGYFDVMILAAADAAALGDTLAAWGFLHDGNNAAVGPLLDDYVQRGWTFVTMKIDSTAFAAAFPGDEEDYVYAGLAPVRLRFSVDSPVYPMRLSSASAASRTKVAIFVCADHRMEVSGATATYANQISGSEWNAMAGPYPTATARLGPGRFLTRLDLTLSPEQMTADLAITRAPADTEFREIRYSGFPLFGWFVAAWSAAWVAGRLRRHRAAR